MNVALSYVEISILKCIEKLVNEGASRAQTIPTGDSCLKSSLLNSRQMEEMCHPVQQCDSLMRFYSPRGI